MFKWLAKLSIVSLALSLTLRGVSGQDSSYISTIDWSPDGSQMAIGNYAGKVEIWNIETETLETVLRGHTQEIMVMQWSPNGELLATGSPDGTIRIWDVLTGQTLQTMRFSEPIGGLRAINAIDWSPDGTLIASAHQYGAVLVWGPDTGEEQTSYSHNNLTLSTLPFQVRTVAWNPSGTLLASGGSDKRLFLWNTADQNVTEFESEAFRSLGYIQSIAWSPGGANLAVSTAGDGILIFDYASHELLLQIPQPPMSLTRLQWSPDGAVLALSNGDQPDQVSIVDAATGAIVDVIESQEIYGVMTWSPYGGQIAVRSSINQSVDSLDDAIQIVDPSLKRLEAIAAACNAPVSLLQPLAVEGVTEEAIPSSVALNAFAAQLDALPTNAIPPGCAADLRAVAEAIGAQAQ